MKPFKFLALGPNVEYGQCGQGLYYKNSNHVTVGRRQYTQYHDFEHNDSQHNNKLKNFTQLNGNVVYAECHK